MKFLKCYIKLITIGLHLIILALAVVSICFAFNYELFSSSESALNTYEIYTMKDLTFTYTGLIDFSNTIIDFSNKSTHLNSFINLQNAANDVKAIKCLVITLFSMHGLLGVFQLFSYRTKTTFINCFLTTILLVVLRFACITSFKETGLIEATTTWFVVTLILWIAATVISGFQIFLYHYVKKAK